MARVRCYAGAGYPERPIAFEWEGRWLDVVEVLWQARTPEGLVFDVYTQCTFLQAGQGARFRLVWDERSDEWVIKRTLL